MKWFVFVLAGIALLSCNKKDDSPDDITSSLNPLPEQWGLVINYTAKWCGPCGSWGSPRLHEMAGMGKVVAVTNHASGDPMYNPVLFNSMDADRPAGSGIPSFWVGDIKSSDPVSMTQLLGKTPVAGIDMKINRNGDEFSIKAKVKFFNEGVGDFYLSFWMLESGIDGSPSAGSYAQAGNSEPDYTHDFVIRKAHGPDIWGENILADPVSGTVFDKNLTMTIDPSWTNHVYVVACLWNYQSQSTIPKYKFINGFVLQ
jgi:hypothetical protein